MLGCRFFIILLVVVSSSGVVHSQGDYFQKGVSGFEFDAAFFSNDDLSGIGGGFGYSVSGIFDFGLSVSRVSLDDKLAGEDMHATAVSPYVTFHVIKQDSIRFPISVSISGAYERDSYSSDALDLLDWELKGDYFAFGFSIFKNVSTSPAMTIQPRGSFSYVTGSTEISDKYGNSESESNNTTSFGIGVSLLFKTSPTTTFRLHPGISINEDNTTFSLVVGLIVSTIAQ